MAPADTSEEVSATAPRIPQTAIVQRQAVTKTSKKRGTDDKDKGRESKGKKARYCSRLQNSWRHVTSHKIREQNVLHHTV
jgi:hypothetical protein